MKYIWLILLPLCEVAFAQSNMLQLPSQGAFFSGGQDRVRSSDGVECANSVGPRNMYMETGMMLSNADSLSSSTYSSLGSSVISFPAKNQNASMYARIVINLDPPKPELNCSMLYELEIARLKRDLEDSKLVNAGPSAKGEYVK